METVKVIAQEEIHVDLHGSHRPLERGLEQAHERAIMLFGIDDCGHSDRVSEWERSCCSIHIEFVRLILSGGMDGWNTTMIFKAWCERVYDDEDDDE